VESAASGEYWRGALRSLLQATSAWPAARGRAAVDILTSFVIGLDGKRE
jgi:hypothetical protein